MSTEPIRDFEILIHPPADRGGAASVIVHVTPDDRRAEGTFTSPLSDDEVDEALTWMEQGLFDDDFVKEFGGKLFTALFSGEVLEVYRATRGDGSVVRLRLVVDDEDCRADPLGAALRSRGADIPGAPDPIRARDEHDPARTPAGVRCSAADPRAGLVPTRRPSGPGADRGRRHPERAGRPRGSRPRRGARASPRDAVGPPECRARRAESRAPRPGPRRSLHRSCAVRPSHGPNRPPVRDR